MVSYFKNHIRDRKAPKKDECLKFTENYSNLFYQKTWVQIKAFIYNTYAQIKQLILYYIIHATYYLFNTISYIVRFIIWCM